MGPNTGLLGSSYPLEPWSNFTDSSSPESEVAFTMPPPEASESEKDHFLAIEHEEELSQTVKYRVPGERSSSSRQHFAPAAQEGKESLV